MKKLVLSLAVIAFAATGFAADRTWVLSGDSLVSILLANTQKSAGTSKDINSQTINFQGGFNAGMYEVGPTFYYSNYSNGTSETTTGLGVFGRYNFVDNKAGVGIVPYGQLNLSKLTTSKAGGDTDGFSWTLQGGATFFPFNDVVGINGYLAYVDTKTTTSGTDTTTTGFKLATAFNLYF